MSPEPTLQNPLRCAVIGLGMGRFHASTLRRFSSAHLAAVVDQRPDRLEEFAKKPDPPECFTDYREMIRKIQPELVIVALPNVLHLPVTRDALAAGAHVLCEKPAALSVAEAEAMRDAAEAAGRQLGINFSQRFGPAARALKKWVDEGAMGEIYHTYCSWTRRDGFPRFGGWFGQKALSGGGPLIDLGVHRLDLCLWLMGHPRVVSVSGMAHGKIGIPRAAEAGLEFDVEDFATGLVRFENGASLIFEVSWAGHQREAETSRLRIMGTKATLEQVGARTCRHTTRDGVFCTTEMDFSRKEALTSVEEMVECVRNGVPFPGSIAHGIAVQKILDGLYASAASGREVTF